MAGVNLHTHTTFCDGKDTPEELVQAALDAGCPALGFSGHSYVSFDEPSCMSPEAEQAYKAEIARLCAKYAGQIKLFCGIEQDYYSDYLPQGFDYVIGSVHYVQVDGVHYSVDDTTEIFDSTVRDIYDGDVYAFAQDYFKNVADIYNYCKCDIVGHFDLFSKFNEGNVRFDPENPRYVAAAMSALETLVATPAYFEINYGAVARGWRTNPYPEDKFLTYIKQHGNRILYTSDCHNKEYLLCGIPETQGIVLPQVASLV